MIVNDVLFELIGLFEAVFFGALSWVIFRLVSCLVHFEHKARRTLCRADLASSSGNYLGMRYLGFEPKLVPAVDVVPGRNTLFTITDIVVGTVKLSFVVTNHVFGQAFKGVRSSVKFHDGHLQTLV